MLGLSAKLKLRAADLGKKNLSNKKILHKSQQAKESINYLASYN